MAQLKYKTFYGKLFKDHFETEDGQFLALFDYATAYGLGEGKKKFVRCYAQFRKMKNCWQMINHISPHASKLCKLYWRLKNRNNGN